MSRWWRAYDDAVDDPKVQRMPGDLFKAWFNLLCLASRNGGILPPIEDIIFSLRMPEKKVAAILEDLILRGLLDEGDDNKLRPHNWDRRQFQSDVSTERVKQYRERKRNVSSAVSATPPETEQNRTEKEDTADAVPSSDSRFVFESGVIRLTEKDFVRWKAIFPNIDLAAELEGAAEWAAQQPDGKWFPAVSALMAKRNREARERIERSKTAPDFKWKSGIEGVV